MNKQMFPFFYNNYRTLSHLELNFKRRLIVMDLMFENWEYHFHDIFKYPPLSPRNIWLRYSFRPIAWVCFAETFSRISGENASFSGFFSPQIM